MPVEVVDGRAADPQLCLPEFLKRYKAGTVFAVLQKSRIRFKGLLSLTLLMARFISCGVALPGEGLTRESHWFCGACGTQSVHLSE